MRGDQKGKHMRIIGLIKVRNEREIIKDTLDHWAQYCTGGIYVFDDASTDDTAQICRDHPAVKEVLVAPFWDPDREKMEWQARQQILERAQRDANKDDWFVYFDADERLYFERWDLLFEDKVDAIACRLYDVYITPEDFEMTDFRLRNFVGPEYRTIVFFFRNSIHISYDKPDQRIVNLPPDAYVVIAGTVKHYGKGLSVKHWEDTCDYYIDFWPKYRAKWEARKGKAIHNYVSDFDNKLIKFNDVLSGREEGFSLENQTYGQN